MSRRPRWWDALEAGNAPQVDGLVAVEGYSPQGRSPEEVFVMEKAREYLADAVFFEAQQQGQHSIAQAFIYGSGTLQDDDAFARQHRKLWSWGGVPLVYRRKAGLLQLFRCAHKADFVSATGRLQCNPIRQLKIATDIDSDPWWDEYRLRTGTLWNDPNTCELLLSGRRAAHKSLFDSFRALCNQLDEEKVLPRQLRRRLLIQTLLIAYLEQRGVFPADYFGTFRQGATKFFEVLSDGNALVALLAALEERFNGNVFSLNDTDVEKLQGTQQLPRFARLVEAREDRAGQLSLWELYSFRDLPVELISQIYQLFVENTDSSVYTPPFLVRFLVEEALSWSALDRITQAGQVILDPACGSGVFLVEAYRRLIQHWRLRNGLRRPGEKVLKHLLRFVRGVDLEEDAIELAGFSLCLALCDSLQPEEIRRSIKLFPVLRDNTLHYKCFFEAKQAGLLKANAGAVLGNPPFASKLQTDGARAAAQRFVAVNGRLPDNQIGYLFLSEASELLADGGTISMLQQYNFLYNQGSVRFRKAFLERYCVRELLDFVSVRGLFQKGGADTKVIVVVAQKQARAPDAKILHATFRRTGRVDAELGLDLDYYDLHYVPYAKALRSERLWRANLLGGGRALALVERLSTARTLHQYALDRGWEIGEGFIEGETVHRVKAAHLTGRPYLPSDALTAEGIDAAQIVPLEATFFRTAYTERRFAAPMLLIREQMELAHGLWKRGYLTYSQRIVGVCAPQADLERLQKVDRWLTLHKRTIRAYSALTSTGLFAQKATALQANDIYSIPYPAGEDLEISANEKVVVDDVVNYMCDLVRLGERSSAMGLVTAAALANFSTVFTQQISSLYAAHPLQFVGQYSWSGAVCQAYAFGSYQASWENADVLQERIGALVRTKQGAALQLTRVCRLYDGKFVFLLKPDRLRYWLGSIALRDADEVLADLRAQGF